MARITPENVETEGDFALGMGVAIGMFIALFAVGIVLFVIEQGRAPAEQPGRRAARDAPGVALPVAAPTGSAAAHTSP